MNNDIFEELIQISLEDGMISEDEIQLLRSVFTNIKKYNSLLDTALEDGIITEEEKSNLTQARSQILSDAYDTASDDNKVTQSEFSMLQQILEIIYKLELDEQSKLDKMT